MRWHTAGSKAYDFLLPKVCNGAEEFESNDGLERKLGDVIVRRELTYGFLRKRKNIAEVVEGRMKERSRSEQKGLRELCFKLVLRVTI